MFTKKIIIFTILFLFLSTSCLQAACPLESINNLSIGTQTPDDTPRIIRLQSILYINNLYSGPITGYYGNLTKIAINKLKQSYNLPTDGIVDSDTINILCDNYTLCPFQSFLQNGDESPKKEIQFIQYFLKLIPNIYPEKLVTGYFGTKTKNAVKRLQESLNISQTGKIDESTRETFCNFFANFDSKDTNSKDNQDNTSPISKVVCVASTKQADINETITFISQIIGNQNSPFKYIWNNKVANNQKTFETSFTSSGNKTINLKVIDSKGGIFTTNCSVKINNSISDVGNLNDEISLLFDFDLNKKVQNSSTDQDSTFQESTEYQSDEWLQNQSNTQIDTSTNQKDTNTSNQPDTSTNQNNTNNSNQSDTSSSQNNTTTQQSNNKIIYTYVRHKCSSTDGCVPCDPKEWCKFDSYWNCFDYCWAEQAKPAIQRKTEKSDVPQDSGALYDKPQDSTYNPLAPIISEAQKQYDAALSSKYKCAFGSQCIPCTNGQVKTDKTCWYDSAEQCKSSGCKSN